MPDDSVVADHAHFPRFAHWLREIDDAQLAEIVQSRPDAFSPLPSSIDVVATRLQLAASTARAVDGLDSSQLITLHAAVCLGADVTPVRISEIASSLRNTVSPATSSSEKKARTTHLRTVDQTVNALRSTALLWGSDPIGVPATAANAATAVPVWSAPSSSDLPIDQVAQLWSDLGEGPRKLLHTISVAPSPLAHSDKARDGRMAEIVHDLAEKKLVNIIDEHTIGLPFASLRYGRYGERALHSSAVATPDWEGTDRGQDTVDGSCAAHALDVLHHCEALLGQLETSPAVALRAGGIGVRERNRLTKAAGVPEDRVSLLLEVLSAAGLLATGAGIFNETTYSEDHVWAPTDRVDWWRSRSLSDRWAHLLLGWWSMPRKLAASGPQPDPNGAALSDELHYPRILGDRHRVLAALSRTRPGLDLTGHDLREVLRWFSPQWFTRTGHNCASAIIAEARVLGVIDNNAISSAGRSLTELPQTPPDMATFPISQTLARMLPDAVSNIIVQADHTILAPGPLEPELEREVALMADLESSGTASTYRLTDTSLRRALDSGRTADDLTNLLASTSLTPVPQAVNYLIADAARRHGHLRIGSASSFIRCDDQSLISQVLSSELAEHLAIRAIAPTVLISQAAPGDLVTGLHELGFAPVMENTSGVVVALRKQVARVPLPVRRALRDPGYAGVSGSSSESRETVIALRSADSSARTSEVATAGKTTGDAAVTALHEARRAATKVEITAVDASGRATRTILTPTSVGGGKVTGTESVAGRAVQVMLHRVVSVAFVTGDR